MEVIGRMLSWFERLFEGRNPKDLQKYRLMARIVSLSELAYANIDKNEQTIIGVKSNGLILDCVYKGMKCDVEHFKHYLHPTFLNCFTFHPNTTSERSEILTGPQNGLSLILRSEPSPLSGYDEVDLTGNTDSIRVAIHPPNTVPFLKNNGIDLEPGKSTSLSLMMRKYERFGSPYTACEKKEFFTVNAREYESTSSVCREKCIAETLQKQCNCTSTMFEDLVSHDKYPYCLTIGENDNIDTVNSRSICEIGFMNNLLGLNCDNCIWDCNEIEYDTQIAFADWPHATRVRSLMRLYITAQNCDHPLRRYFTTLVHNSKVVPEDFSPGELCPMPVINDTKMPFSLISAANAASEPGSLMRYARPDFTQVYRYQMDHPFWYDNINDANELILKWIQDSFYRLNVYFKKSTVEQHIQVASFSLADLWSGVGGILGLWLGISVMTIIEVMSFIFHSITKCFKKKTNTKAVGTLQVKDEKTVNENCDLSQVS